MSQGILPTTSKSKKKTGTTSNDKRTRLTGKSPAKRAALRRSSGESSDSLPQAEVTIRNIISRSTSSSRCLIRLSRMSAVKVTFHKLLKNLLKLQTSS